MKKGLTEIVFILDRSGSMSGLEEDTIGGFNSMLQKQKLVDGEAILSCVLFDNVSEVIYDRIDINKINPMTSNEYFVRGSTALLDALGGAIHHISNVHRYIREEDVPEKTIFIITTDGMENSSHKYNSALVKKLVEEKKQKNSWEFIFLGANIDAVETASSFGIDRQHAANYNCDSVGTKLNFDVVGKAISKMRCAESAPKMASVFYEEDALMEIRNDHKKRGFRKA